MRNSCRSSPYGRAVPDCGLRPFKIGHFNRPQAVPEGNQDQRSVSLAVAPKLGG
jgi:hypothetical protein